MTALLTLSLCLSAGGPADRPTVLVVVGAAGAEEYEPQFRKWADQWKAAAERGAAEFHAIGLEPSGGETDRDRLKRFLAGQAATPSAEPLWVVLIGHGTFDGRDARFNLRGPDITPAELGTSLSPVKRPLVLIDCASASGPFLPALSGPNRIVITAARSGNELNYARFGEYLAGAIADPTADLDKDGQVSLLEAYLVAGSRVAAFYKDANRLATEHPLLDDNGDKLGTPPDRFRALRSTEKVKAGAVPDGIRAHQISLVPSGGERALPAAVRQKRDELERSLEALRGRKAQLAEDDYYAEVEKIMVELARLYVESQ